MRANWATSDRQRPCRCTASRSGVSSAKQYRQYKTGYLKKQERVPQIRMLVYRSLCSLALLAAGRALQSLQACMGRIMHGVFFGHKNLAVSFMVSLCNARDGCGF